LFESEDILRNAIVCFADKDEMTLPAPQIWNRTARRMALGEHEIAMEMPQLYWSFNNWNDCASQDSDHSG
jgi:hypothetical protein